MVRTHNCCDENVASHVLSSSHVLSYFTDRAKSPPLTSGVGAASWPRRRHSRTTHFHAGLPGRLSHHAQRGAGGAISGCSSPSCSYPSKNLKNPSSIITKSM